jgi:GTP-binding protein
MIDPLPIRSVDYIGTIVDPKAPIPEGSTLPQVAFAGRSNVGKSSLINTLLRRTRKKIAHVSSTPGKTQAVNFFKVNEDFLLVDLPGYGFAKVPFEVQKGWKHLVEGYLAREDGPVAVLFLLDIRRDPAGEDRQMLDFLAQTGLPTLIVLTKMDKLTKRQQTVRVDAVVKELGLDPEQVVPFSSLNGEGRLPVLTAVAELCGVGAAKADAVNLGDTEGADVDAGAGDATEEAAEP